MNIRVAKETLYNVATEALVIPHCEEDGHLTEAVQRLDLKLGMLLHNFLQKGDFTGKSNQITLLYPVEAIPAPRILLIGLGKRVELDREKVRAAFGKAARYLRDLEIKKFAVATDIGPSLLTSDATIEAVIEGIILGLYQFTTFKTLERDKIKIIEEVMILEEKEESLAMARDATRSAEIICKAVCFARDLVSAPGNKMTPSALAGEAKSLTMNRKKLKVTIIDDQEMKDLGMNALLGVASGSCQPPKFIIMEYRGLRKKISPIVLVGKGLTFDSGGISLKPSERMEDMKSDMAGGAAVMGTLRAIADLNLPLNVIGLIPATENLPGGKAYKPGDILTSLSGQTIEVTNTDAEGRLILADALTYACNFKPAAIIDIATLTGACIIALGEQVSALLSKDENLKLGLKAAADITGEKIWELPLWEEYGEAIKSDIADFKNAGGRPGGTITAAAFLSKFVDSYPWAHLDIAGPSWLSKDKPYIPKGASGVGVRLLVRFLRDLSRNC